MYMSASVVACVYLGRYIKWSIFLFSSLGRQTFESRSGVQSSHLSQLSLPSRVGKLRMVPALLAGVKVGCVRLCRWRQVILWSIRQVTPRSSETGFPIKNLHGCNFNLVQCYWRSIIEQNNISMIQKLLVLTTTFLQAATWQTAIPEVILRVVWRPFRARCSWVARTSQQLAHIVNVWINWRTCCAVTTEQNRTWTASYYGRPNVVSYTLIIILWVNKTQ